VISKLKPGVEDLSISRATLKWGIPLPNDPDHVLYVWIDALSNYITALGYGTGDDARFRRYWPADAHVIGKDILWFHAVYWPAMLFSLGLEPPRSVVAHGWFKGEGRKMSKTLGNFVDLEKVRATIALYGLDSLRYFLLQVAPFGEDPDWSDAGLVKSHTELGNVLGNCLNRSLKMVNKYRDGVIPAASELEEIDRALLTRIEQFPAALAGAYERYALQHCAQLPIELARAANGYIDATAPFSLAKDPAKAKRLDTVLALSARAIRDALVGLLPILPEKAAAGLEQLGVQVAGKNMAALFSAELIGVKIGEGQPLFPRIEAK
jgi:methionyl-tRNA synthetase